MSSGPWRTPSGSAPVAGLRSPAAVIEAVIAHTLGAIEGAIAHRVRAGEISDRGDAASTYFLDPERIQTLIHGPGEPPADQLRADADHARAEATLLAQLATSPHALARAFARWQLADDDRRIVLALIAAQLSSRVSRLLALLGGDPAAPHLVVEAIAALVAPGDAGLRRLAERLAALEALALVQLGRPDLPLPRRPIAPAPRLLELIFDRVALDPACGAVIVDGSYRAVRPAVRDAVRAVLDHVRPVVGAVALEHDGVGALAAALADAERALIVAPLAHAVDPARCAVLVREALLIDAALAIELGVSGGVAAGAALDALALRVPTFLVYPPDAVPPRLTVASLSIPALPPDAEQLATVLARFESLAAPDLAPAHPLAIARAADAIAARGPDEPIAAIVEQLLPVAPAGALRLVASAPPARSADLIDRIVERWRALERPRRLAVLIAGVRGIGRARLAVGVAQALGIQAFQLDGTRPIPAALSEAIDAGAALAILRDLGEEEIRGLRSNSWWQRAHGLLVVTTSKPSEGPDFDVQLRLEPPNARERAQLWALALASRGAALEATALQDLARFQLGEQRIAAVVRAATDLTVGALVAAVQRELAERPPERS